MGSKARLLGLIGASGNEGQAILKHLLNSLKVPPKEIVAVSRTPEKLADYTKLGVQARKGDFNDVSSLQEAFKGVTRLLVISGNDFQNRLKHHKNAFEAAAAVGVKHVVYSGVADPTKGTKTSDILQDHFETEKILKSIKGITWNVLGCNFWHDTHTIPFKFAAKTGTLWVTNAASKCSYVSRDDCALACATVLASNSTNNVKYNLTGSEALDRKEVAALFSKTLGLKTPIKVVEVSADDLKKNMAAAQAPEMLIFLNVFEDTLFATGSLSEVSDDFKKLTGKDPVKLADWLEQNKAALAN